MIVFLRFCILVSLFLLPGTVGAANSPKATVEEAVSQVMALINDPELRQENREKEQIERISDIIDAVFDYPRIARLALGKNWTRITPEEQEEFTTLFSEFLRRVYITKITSYPGSKTEFHNAVALSAKVSEVRTTVHSKKAKIPIAYRLVTTENDWKVYDVIVEGVSLLKNYRSQFHTILSNRPMENLLAQLRTKVREDRK